MSLDAQGVDDVGRRALEFSAETEAAEQLVAEILQFPRDERAAQLDATCVAHPGLDGKIRALYRDVLHIDAWLDAPERLGGDDVAPE